MELDLSLSNSNRVDYTYNKATTARANKNVELPAISEKKTRDFLQACKLICHVARMPSTFIAQKDRKKCAWLEFNNQLPTKEETFNLYHCTIKAAIVKWHVRDFPVDSLSATDFLSVIITILPHKKSERSDLFSLLLSTCNDKLAHA